MALQPLLSPEVLELYQLIEPLGLVAVLSFSEQSPHSFGILEFLRFPEFLEFAALSDAGILGVIWIWGLPECSEFVKLPEAIEVLAALEVRETLGILRII